MNEFDLNLKIKVLEEKAEALRGTLGVAISEAQVAREELANISKPVITEDVAVDLVSNLCRIFSEALSNIDGSDLEIDLCLEYDNKITIDGISGLDDIDEPADEIHDVLADIFNIVDADTGLNHFVEDNGDDLIAHVDNID